MGSRECRPQSPPEEAANSISHGIGLLAALGGMPFLIITASRQGSARTVTAITVFCISALLMYGCSTLYHALPEGRAKRLFQVLDHSAIYLLIAGTYTPFTLDVLQGALGWTLFGVVWGLAAVGVLLKSTGRLAHSGWSNALYLLMGWLIVAALGPLIRGLSAAAIAWLVAGGLAYTAGVVFYVADHKRYAHFIWHLFVLTGTGCHAGAIWCLASAGAAGR